jgi:hypothetical protein
MLVSQTNTKKTQVCGNKTPTRWNRCFFIADLIACSTCFGHHYAHHQELESIIQLFAACGLWCLVFKLSVWCGAEGCVSDLRAAAAYRQLENQAPKTTSGNQLYNTLELLMMGIMVPETCWASNKICNKKHLLHQVGILFPHINDDVRSK